MQCTLSIKELLSLYPEPMFYDVFMVLGGNENMRLLPLPSLVNNQQYNGRFINQGPYLFYSFVIVECLSLSLKVMLGCFFAFNREHEKLVPVSPSVSC